MFTVTCIPNVHSSSIPNEVSTSKTETESEPVVVSTPGFHAASLGQFAQVLLKGVEVDSRHVAAYMYIIN